MLELNTIGITIGGVAETTAGTRPTSGFVDVPNVTSIGELNLTPAQLEVTDLSDTIKRFIDGVQDPNGGNLQLGVNITADFKTKWAAHCTAYATALAAGKAYWWKITVPNLGSYYVAGKPSDLGFPGAEVNNVLTGQVNITLNQVAGWAS